MDVEQGAAQIKRIYHAHTPPGQWMAIAKIAEYTDMTPAQIAAACRHLFKTDDSFNIAPESNQKMLTRMDHTYAVHMGAQDKHIISFD